MRKIAYESDIEVGDRYEDVLSYFENSRKKFKAQDNELTVFPNDRCCCTYYFDESGCHERSESLYYG